MKNIVVLILVIAVAVAGYFFLSLSPGPFETPPARELSPAVEPPHAVAPDSGGPVFPPAIPEDAIEEMKAACGPLMALSPAAIAELVPQQGGIYFTDCPACDASTQDRGNFVWSPETPDRMVCEDCEAVFPGHPEFVESGVLEVESLGKVHRFPYYEQANGYRMYFEAKRDDLARIYLSQRCLDLARLWWVTKDDAYAERAAAILLRFAEVYPAYTLHYDAPNAQKVIRPADYGYIRFGEENPDWELAPTRTSKWSWWGYMDLSQDLAGAYDILKTWPGLVEMAGGDAKARIENDLLGHMVDWTLGFREDFTNMAPTKWRAAVHAARILGRPEPIHDVIGRVEEFFSTRFHYDGSWFETSPSYVLQVWGNMSVMQEVLQGYEDPPDYRHPETGNRIDPKAIETLLARRDNIYASVMATRLPDGRLLPVNDTWSSGKRELRATMEAVLAPGFGVAVQGGGAGKNQIHGWLNFTSGHHHNQWSTLSIGLWANGRELLSDIGYTWTNYRFWATSTSSHNTVTVDGRDQKFDADYSGNRLRLWVDSGNGFQSAEAESTTAYAHLSRYRRSLIMIGDDARDAYWIDVFQVHGGKQHDFILAGNADDPTTAALDLSLQPFTGTLLNHGVKFSKPAASSDWANRQETGLGFIRNLRSAPASGLVRLDMRGDASPDTGLRSWVDAGDDATIFLGEGPSIRPAGEAGGKLDDFLMPMLVARRTSERSVFVAVHEPVGERPAIDSVVVERPDGVVVITVQRGPATDVVFVGLDGPLVEVRAEVAGGGIEFRGRQGMVRIEGGRATAMHLIGGSLLRFGDKELTSAPVFGGEIRGLARTGNEGGWFEVAETIDASFHAATFITRLPDGTVQGYNVTAIEPVADGTRIRVRETPAFEPSADGVEMIFFPQRSIKGGAVTYEMVGSAHFRSVD